MGQIAWGSDSLLEGGAFEDGQYEFSDCKFIKTDYEGQIEDLITVFQSTLIDEDGEEREQSWSVGGKGFLVPSSDGENEADDGPYLITTNDAKCRGVHNQSNFGMLVASMGLVGFPADKFDGSAPCLDGLVADMVQEEIERKGLKPIKGQEDKKHYAVIVKEIHKFPWDEAKAAAKGKAATKTAAKTATKGKTAAAAKGKTATTESDDIADECVGLILGIISEKGGSISKGALAGAVFKATAGNPNRNALVKMCGDAAFLGEEERPWEFEGNMLKLAE